MGSSRFPSREFLSSRLSLSLKLQTKPRAHLSRLPPVLSQILTQSPHLPHTLPPSWLSSLENSLPRLPRSLQPASQPNDSDDSDDDDEEEEEDAFASFTALIKGPKRSGKSTFARALVNGLLDRYRYVAVLEADLGQGEWGVEGSVSLVVVEQGILGESEPSFCAILRERRE